MWRGVKLGRARLQLGYFWALGTRVVSSTIWFVADVLKLTAGVAAGPTVEVMTDGCLLGVLWEVGGQWKRSQRCWRQK